jgi:hypothetical protein
VTNGGTAAANVGVTVTMVDAGGAALGSVDMSQRTGPSQLKPTEYGNFRGCCLTRLLDRAAFSSFGPRSPSKR